MATTPSEANPPYGWSLTLLASDPSFVYTWISIEVIHCVNSSVTWWPKVFNHGCSMSLPIQRCTPSWYKNQFHSMANLSHFVGHCFTLSFGLPLPRVLLKMFYTCYIDTRNHVFKESKQYLSLPLLPPYCISNALPLYGLWAQFKLYPKLCVPNLKLSHSFSYFQVFHVVSSKYVHETFFPRVGSELLNIWEHLSF
jgi:hypothetical protein